MAILIVVLVIVAVVAIAVAAWLFLRQRQSTRLQEQFGPEYDRAVQATGNQRRAEHELAERQQRVERFHIQTLAATDRTRFAESWRVTQARFVDDPPGAISDADRLIADVMQKRGYPVGDFEAQAADLSVDHPSVVTNYRAAHRIAGENAGGGASTEALRQAMVHYRSLFDELLETQQEARR